MDTTFLQRFNPLENESLKRHCTFKIGGIVHFFFLPGSIEALIELIKTLEEQNKQYHIIGRGSNILFSDDMKTEIIISTKAIKNMKITDNRLTVDCGVSLREFCYRCARESLSGAEGLSGIPGTIGGAVYMNAGAYGYSTDQIVESVEVCNIKTHKLHIFSTEECKFQYRQTKFMNSDYLILRTTFKLKKTESTENILNVMKIYEQKRADRQPLSLPSAGSVFKKPYDTFYPAKEIEELGLKGFCVGDACVSEKHSGFIVNQKEAKSEEVKKLIELVREKIFMKTGIRLKTEIKYLD